LGVGEFQKKYFGNHPLYLDSNRVFYDFLGNRSLLSQPWSSWNPFQIYSDLTAMGDRMKRKGVEGNYKGEGLLQGGVIIIDNKKQLVKVFHEQTGSELPVQQIYEAIVEMVRPSSGDSGTCVGMEGKTGQSG
jgi:AhpC/TSA antioxidant enzyme